MKAYALQSEKSSDTNRCWTVKCNKPAVYVYRKQYDDPFIEGEEYVQLCEDCFNHFKGILSPEFVTKVTKII